MMINKRLIGVVPDSKKYIARNVILQWCSLAANIALMTGITALMQGLWSKTAGQSEFLITAASAAVTIFVRFVCTVGASRMSYLSSKAVKKTLREKIYEKLLRLGASYNERCVKSKMNFRRKRAASISNCDAARVFLEYQVNLKI